MTKHSNKIKTDKLLNDILRKLKKSNLDCKEVVVDASDASETSEDSKPKLITSHCKVDHADNEVIVCEKPKKHTYKDKHHVDKEDNESFIIVTEIYTPKKNHRKHKSKSQPCTSKPSKRAKRVKCPPPPCDSSSSSSCSVRKCDSSTSSCWSDICCT